MLLTHPILLALLQDDAAPTEESGPNMVFPLIAMAAIFWFVLIAPDRKARKQRQAMLSELKKGQEVMTTGGILGKVVEVREDRVLLQVSDNTRLHFSRQAIQTVLEKSDAKPAKGSSEEKGGKSEKGGKAEAKQAAREGAPRGIKED